MQAAASPNPSHLQLLPTFFIPHGAGPCFFMDWKPADTWNSMASFLKGISESLPVQPRAIVVVSGHWLEPAFKTTAHARPELIYDYYGFPPHTYELRYPAPGDPELASTVAATLQQHGFAAAVDNDRGFDHGVFIPFKLVYPDADIPIIQLSLRQDLNAMAHVAAGKALSRLRAQGVLIVGSGMSFHNMRGYGDTRFTHLSEVFDRWLTESVEADPVERNRRLENWEAAPFARDCHPPRAEEHLLPLMVVAGAAGESVGRKVYSDRILETQISAFRFG